MMDVERIILIMDKYNLNKRQVAAIIGITHKGVEHWFDGADNPAGKVPAKHFDTLTAAGYIL